MRNRFSRKIRLLFLALSLLAVCHAVSRPLSAHAGGRLQDPGDTLVVVIDPGHGGENQGTTENGYLEKEMDMTTAMAMYEELCKFEGIEVYLTHTDDVDPTLRERAEFAAKKEADLLVSLHYNASETHLLYGAEAWISLQPKFHAYGYQFATVAMRQLRELGMNLRGIKTKARKRGDDYYGVIREAVDLDVPAVILEHCHVDHPEDSLHCDTQEELVAFGVADAHAVAKYFGLRSASLGIDYSGYPDTLPDVSPTQSVLRAEYDGTEPEVCAVEVSEVFYEEDRVLVKVSASDRESNLIYYAFSLDGGKTYSKIMPWPEGDILTGEFENEFLMELEIPDGTTPEICFRAYNPYDVFATSNLLTFPQEFRKPQPPEEIQETQELSDDAELQVPAAAADTTQKKEAASRFLLALKLCIAIVLAVFLTLLVLHLVQKKRDSQKS